MIKNINPLISITTVLFTLVVNIWAQVTITGYVLTVSGVPIKGATVTLVDANKTAITDDKGFYDFSLTGSHSVPGDNTFNYLRAWGNRLFLNLEKRENVSVAFYNLSGKLIQTMLNKAMTPGNHAITIDLAQQAGQQLYCAQVKVGAETAWYKVTVLDNYSIGLSAPHSGSSNVQTEAKAPASSDSLIVTHPDYFGGLDEINTRKISSTTGTQNFRMFSSDTTDATGWFASQMNFVFTPHHEGVDYYKKVVGDWVAAQRWTQRCIQQCLYFKPSDVPSSKKWSTYKVNINANVSTSVASTGGNTCNVNPRYVNNKPWWEIEGVHHHEMVHSYQQFYSTSGASGFGEGITDGIRALVGFFYWPEGKKCSGGYQQAYQGGGKYWYFIELKHPGFIAALMNMPNSGHIEDRVEQITGVPLDDLCDECENDGMPYTLGRGKF